MSLNQRKELPAEVEIPTVDHVALFIDAADGLGYLKDVLGNITPLAGGDGVGVPAGGTAGQVLTKQSSTDFDTDWETPSAGGGGASPTDTHAWQPVGALVGGVPESLFDSSGNHVMAYGPL